MKIALLFQCNSILPSAAEISTRGSTERLCSSSTFAHTMRSFITATLITRLGNHCQGRVDNDALSPAPLSRTEPILREPSTTAILCCSRKYCLGTGKWKWQTPAAVWPAAEVFICAALMVLQTAIISEQMHSQFMMCLLEIFKITLQNSYRQSVESQQCECSCCKKRVNALRMTDLKCVLKWGWVCYTISTVYLA